MKALIAESEVYDVNELIIGKSVHRQSGNLFKLIFWLMTCQSCTMGGLERNMLHFLLEIETLLTQEYYFQALFQSSFQQISRPPSVSCLIRSSGKLPVKLDWLQRTRKNFFWAKEPSLWLLEGIQRKASVDVSGFR